MKIFAGGIATESNTFSPIPTSLDDFIVQRGADALAGRVEYPSLNLQEIWGSHAKRSGDVFVFSLMAWAQPSGVTIRSAYESLRDELLADLRATVPVDVVLLMLHGAMIAQGYDDCEEDIIRRVREIVGPDAAIGVELDLHCHLSPSKIAQADIVIAFKEYPHVDTNERAIEVFDWTTASKRGEIRPRMALFDCRMVGLYPTTRQPLRGFVDAMTEAEKRPGVISVSFGHGFQFGDLPHLGAKILVVTDNDEALAEQVASELGLSIYDLRHEIGFESISVPMDEALTRALGSSGGTVVVADQSDNAGGGAPADATFALRWLMDHGATGVGMAILYDPEVVRLAIKVGPQASILIRLGGKMGEASGSPVDVMATVLAIRRDYMHEFPQQQGEPIMFPAGDVVALRCGGIDIIVSSQRCQCFAPSIFTDLGVDPRHKRILVVKSVQHFHSSFVPLAREVIYMAAPGAVPPDPRQIVYRRARVSEMYPWLNDPMSRGT